MALYVKTNVSSLNAQRHLAKSGNALDTSARRLASGLRINSARDDAAGLQISDRLTSQSGSPPAVTVSADLDAPRGEYTAEVKSLCQYTSIHKAIPYRVKDEDGIYIEGEQVTYGTGTITFSYGSEERPRSVTVQVNEGDTLDDIAANLRRICVGQGGDLDFYYSRYNDNYSYDLQGCVSMHMYTDYGSDYSKPISISTAGDESLRVFDCNNATPHHTDASGWYLYNLGVDTVLEIDGDSFVSSNTKTFYDAARGLTITANRVSGPFTITVDPETLFNVDTAEHAQSAIAIADRFIAAVDSKRSELGAAQNRLESAIRNQANVAENASAARSRIRDTDFAVESASLAQQNILQETSKSVLASANHSTEFILSLLQQ